jgi:DNA-binding transcriptional regulator YiaG
VTPADLRSARKRLGLTQKGLAGALRMGTHGWQSVSKWERDGSAIPGPVQVAVELLLASVDTHAERQDPVEGLGPKDG